MWPWQRDPEGHWPRGSPGGMLVELVALVLSCFVAAIAAPALHRPLGHRLGGLLALVPAAGFAWLITTVGGVSHGTYPAWSMAWLEALGVALSFRLDGLGLLFAFLITGIGFFISLYAGAYLKDHTHQGRFFLYLYLFMGAMLGVVLADDLIAFFVFWELTSISSYFLIGFHTEDAESRRSALMALLVTGAGGLALLAGLILLAIATGETSLSAINAAGPLGGHGLYTPVLVLILLGAFTKSAQFPFHFWLPGAMVAPTPVSAYLHSATMVKAGVYLLARLHPSLGGTMAWTATLVLFGLATLAVGTVLALRHTDLKRILAYTTVATLGLLVLLLGIGTEHAVQGAMAYLLAHALYKGALFLVAGSVDHGTGTRDIRRLGGLRKAMPYTAAAGFLAALSFMGLPPFLGFIGKEVLLGAVLELTDGLGLAIVLAVLLAGGFLAAYLAGFRPFVGRTGESPDEPHESPPSMLAGPLVLALAGLAFGLWPKAADHALVSPAAGAALGRATEAHLALWHGFNLPLLFSALVVVAAGAVIAARVDLKALLDRGFGGLDGAGPETWYTASVAGLLRGAKRQARWLQNGRLRVYLLVLLATTAGAGFTALLWLDGGGLASAPTWDASVAEVVVVLVMIVAAVAVTRVQSRLAAVAILGLVGYSVAALFIFYSAPDLAMTQFLFETLSVLLFAYVLWGMPRLVRRSKARVRASDAVLPAAVGLLMGWLALAAMTERFHDPISWFFAAQSYVEAHGRNVVNVILVDFRALDTLGEITVLAVAALGVVGLLRLRPGGDA